MDLVVCPKIQYTPEQHYQRERNPGHGWNHSSDVHGVEDECIPGCRFWPNEGGIEAIEILRDYEGYSPYDQVLKTWQELVRSD